MQIWGVAWTDAFQAVGTVGAVVVALGIAGADYFQNTRTRRKQEKQEEKRTAGLVSAWVETTYQPSQSGKRYDKLSYLHVSNESDEPVFNVNVVVAIGDPPRQIGPVSAPVPIPTLSPRRERVFDISSGLLAHELGEGSVYFDEPQVRISFTDRRSVRWHRDFQGTLSEDDGKLINPFENATEDNFGQFGVMSPLNPLAVAVGFLNAATETPRPNLSDAKKFLDPSANGWNNISDPELIKALQELRGFAVAAHVWYRTPRVAYVRILKENALPKNVSAQDGFQVPANVLTMVFRQDHGWAVFAIGGSSPDWIEFSEGETTSPLRAYLDGPESRPVKRRKPKGRTDRT